MDIVEKFPVTSKLSLWAKTAHNATLPVILNFCTLRCALCYMCVRGSVASAKFCPTMYIGIVMRASAATGSQNRYG